VKILVCDDSKAMRMIVVRALRQAGFGDAEIHEAENGAEGLAKVAELAPDLVLSDWNMPEMTGIQFLHALRDRGDSVRFGFITSETTPEMREKAITGGAAFLLGKPFTAEDVAEAVSAVLA
jgi:two-component system, chemotaxis family, chemotaxis protein CheY